jgi:uncharacterized membrane protein YbaN (DUF454 family)
MARPLTGPAKWLLLAIGWIAVGLAALGAFLPLLPTVPFLLVAAWAFGRSSTRLHGWLYNNRMFGPLLRDWQQHGAIPRWAKVMAVLAMSLAMFGLTQRESIPLWVLIAVGVTLATVSVWIVTRPSGPSDDRRKD